MTGQSRIVFVEPPLEHGTHKWCTGAHNAQCRFQLAPDGNKEHRVCRVLKAVNLHGVDSDDRNDADSIKAHVRICAWGVRSKKIA